MRQSQWPMFQIHCLSSEELGTIYQKSITIYLYGIITSILCQDAQHLRKRGPADSDGRNASTTTWKMQKDLRPKKWTCDECQQPMNWPTVSLARDGYVSKYQIKGCNKLKVVVLVRTGIFFGNLAKKSQTWLTFLFFSQTIFGITALPAMVDV